MNKGEKEKYTDEELLDGLKQRNNPIIEFIYTNYLAMITSMVGRNSGTEEDSEDVLQDALIIVYKRIIAGDFVLTSSFKTFFYSVCRNLWLQRLNKCHGKTIHLSDVEEYVSISESLQYEIIEPAEERKRVYYKHYACLTPDCQRILRLFAEGKSLREISLLMQYKTEEYAKSRKYQCKENLKKRIKNDPSYKRLQGNENK